MLIGVINSVFDTYEGKRAKFYQVNLEMIELESNTKVWIGDNQIKKLVEQDEYKWQDRSVIAIRQLTEKQSQIYKKDCFLYFDHAK